MRQLAGWSISIVFYALGAVMPGAEMSTEVQPSALEVQYVHESADRVQAQMSVSATTKAVKVLTMSYSLGETGPRVSTLQRVIGTVRVDGEYGEITRREHIEALANRGLPATNVPPVNTKTAGSEYDIPSDPSKRCPQWIPLFKEYGLEPVEVFSYIAWRESGCNPQAQNAKWDANGNMTYHLNKDKSYDTGLLQINSSWYSVTKLVCGNDSVDGRMAGLKDPVCNVRVAKYIMDNSKGKLGNWRVYKN